MKKTLLLFTILALCINVKAQSPQFQFWFTKDNVDVYSRWTCASCDDRHVQIKLVNRNDYAITYFFKYFIWKLDGIEISKATGAQDDIPANGTAGGNGDLSGLYFYPPTNYGKSPLEINITALTVTKK